MTALYVKPRENIMENVPTAVRLLSSAPGTGPGIAALLVAASLIAGPVARW